GLRDIGEIRRQSLLSMAFNWSTSRAFTASCHFWIKGSDMLNSSKPIVFETRHRAKFEEIDPFGHLNVNHYLSYFSENRFAGQREVLGLYIRDLGKLTFAFHTVKCELEFKCPVFLDDEF